MLRCNDFHCRRTSAPNIAASVLIVCGEQWDDAALVNLLMKRKQLASDPTLSASAQAMCLARALDARPPAPSTVPYYMVYGTPPRRNWSTTRSAPIRSQRLPIANR
jgi:hypothetical protein